MGLAFEANNEYFGDIPTFFDIKLGFTPWIRLILFFDSIVILEDIFSSYHSLSKFLVHGIQAEYM